MCCWSPSLFTPSFYTTTLDYSRTKSPAQIPRTGAYVAFLTLRAANPSAAGVVEGRTVTASGATYTTR